MPIDRNIDKNICDIFIQWNATQQYKGQTTDKHNNIDGFQRHYIKQEKPDRGLHTL